MFDNSNPSFWALAALVSPRFLMPTLRFLSGKFPSKGAAESKEAFETIYDACDNLIEVGGKAELPAHSLAWGVSYMGDSAIHSG